MTRGKRLRIAALFVIVLVFAFIMDMSSNAITDNTLIRNDTGDGDAVYDLVLNADGLDEDYSYQLKLKEEQPSDKQANELFTQAKNEIDDCFCEKGQSVEQVRGHIIMKEAYAAEKNLLLAQEEELKAQYGMAEQRQALLKEKIHMSTEQISAAERIAPYQGLTKLTPELARELIKRIVIRPDERIRIEWNFSDELSGLVEFPEICFKKQAI